MAEDASNRRQDFRVDDIIPMKDQPLTTEEYEIRKNHVGIRSRQSSMLREMVGSDVFSNELRGKLNSEMADAMEALDSKLNYLIGVNMLNDAQRSDLVDRPINLSITGASFVSDQDYTENTPIFLILMLPSFPPTTLELLGNVMWSRKTPDGRPYIGVRFIYRCDEEEDTIAKYVFRRHREMIRLKRKEDEI
ncbi:MAG: PilZ domain-containing protein [Mariprofundaceae bacterium]